MAPCCAEGERLKDALASTIAAADVAKAARPAYAAAAAAYRAHRATHGGGQ